MNKISSILVLWSLWNLSWEHFNQSQAKHSVTSYDAFITDYYYDFKT